jgi:tripartite-type tricarboxylate transporter receptor subunit TctC
VGRTVSGERLSEHWAKAGDRPKTVPGAGGTIGCEAKPARAPAGWFYTLFNGTSAPNGTQPQHVQGFSRYNPATDFAPVALVATAPRMIVRDPVPPP